tara:strand:- start:2469 stop:2885 length:417 start_codon:yes stop_codon:yes gene_type:complete
MNALITLGIIIVIYYQINQRYTSFSDQTNLYFGIFIVFYLVMYYLMVHERAFMYQVFSNMKKADDQPMEDEGYTYKNDKNIILKNSLAQKQNWRCMHCNSNLSELELYDYSINYIIPLEYNGSNDINNLGIKCNRCFL